MNVFQFALAALLAATVNSVEASNATLAPLHEARGVGKKQITDDKGLVYYIVDLVDHAQDAFSDARTAKGKQRFHERHSGKAQNMVEAFERQYGFDYVEMTSWVGNSFSAYLSQAQVENLRADPRVKLVSEVTEVTLSAAPWYDSTIPTLESPYYETHSWGKNAVTAFSKISNNTRRVYIIDIGVGDHEDLTNVITRVNASSGISLVGCYPHATHVAGIIGAAYGNKGVAGVNAGAKLISVSALNTNSSQASCAEYRPIEDAALGSAMDWVKWDIVLNGASQTGIVNISINGPSFRPGKTLNIKMLNLATPYLGGYYHPGAFIAQSAGNGFVSACTGLTQPLTGNQVEGQYASFGYSGGTPNTTDGIMVVGAINNNGQPVTTNNGGFNYGSAYGGYESGSNFGSCVEVWAPGNNIYSTWGGGGWGVHGRSGHLAKPIGKI